MALAAGARDSLRFQRHHLEIIRQATTAQNRVKTAGERRILRVDAGGVLAFVPVVVGAGGGAELLILSLKRRVVIT